MHQRIKKREYNAGEFYAICGNTAGGRYPVGDDRAGRMDRRPRHRPGSTNNRLPPKVLNNGRWVDINLEEQSLTVYDNSKMVFATLVSTGTEPFFTQPGLFKIYEKKDKETMSGDFSGDKSGYYYLEDVPWTMYFDQTARFAWRLLACQIRIRRLARLCQPFNWGFPLVI